MTDKVPFLYHYAFLWRIISIEENYFLIFT
jgi:hypothetical protein